MWGVILNTICFFIEKLSDSTIPDLYEVSKHTHVDITHGFKWYFAKTLVYSIFGFALLCYFGLGGLFIQSIKIIIQGLTISIQLMYLIILAIIYLLRIGIYKPIKKQYIKNKEKYTQSLDSI